MINFFEIASADQSVYYLGNIFGVIGNLLPVSNPTLILGLMFKVLNTTALTIGAILVVYVVVVGLLKTAQEGEFLGKQWNSLWVPIRTVLGIAALFPTATGYSAIQVIMMWVILQGVGAADAVWTTVLGYAAAVGSPYSAISIPTPSISSNMQTLFQSLVCQASARRSGDIPMTSIGGKVIHYNCTSLPDAKVGGFCGLNSDMLDISGSQSNKSSRTDGSSNVYNMGPGGSCGKLTYCDNSNNTSAYPDAQCEDPESMQCKACLAQQATLKEIVPVLGQIAEKLVQTDYEYVQFYENNQPASWIADYCAANNIAGCCVPSAVPSVAGSSNECSSNFTGMPDTAKDDIRNTNTEVMQKLYLPYAIIPYLNGSTATGVIKSAADINFINAAVDQYVTSLVGAISTQLATQIAKQSANTGAEWIQDAKKQGWILAGAYFYYLANANQTNLQAAQQHFKVEVTPSLSDSSNMMSISRNNFNASSQLLTAIQSQSEASPTYASPAEFNSVTAGLNAATKSGIVHTFIANLSGNSGNLTSLGGKNATQSYTSAGGGSGTQTSPLASLATFGYQLMITAQVIFVVTVAAVFTIVLLTTVEPIVLGTGLTLNPLGEAVKSVLNLVSPFFIALIAALYSLGAVLGIYVPLIPFVIFTVGAVGWFLGVIEAMVSAPIVALGILSPGGQHDILGRAGPTMTFMLNLFLRPSLMIFGLIFAMLLSVAVINLINAGFLAVMQQIMPYPGLFEQILFISAYTSLIVTALNKTFSLIYVLPERVLVWIEGPAVSHGEAEALGATKQAIEGGASTATGSARESGGAAIHAGLAVSDNEFKSKGGVPKAGITKGSTSSASAPDAQPANAPSKKPGE